MALHLLFYFSFVLFVSVIQLIEQVNLPAKYSLRCFTHFPSQFIPGNVVTQNKYSCRSCCSDLLYLTAETTSPILYADLSCLHKNLVQSGTLIYVVCTKILFNLVRSSRRISSSNTTADLVRYSTLSDPGHSIAVVTI